MCTKTYPRVEQPRKSLEIRTRLSDALLILCVQFKFISIIYKSCEFMYVYAYVYLYVCVHVSRVLVGSVKDFLGGKVGRDSVLQLQIFLSADAQNLADAGLGGGVVHTLGLKNGGWRRHVAFEEGALPVLTDVVSEVGDPAIAAAAARCLAMMAAANSKVREAASTAGTVRLLVKMVSNARKGM